MTIDLNQLIRDHGYAAEIAPPESEEDASLRRFKERVAFCVAVFIFVVVVLMLFAWLVLGTPSADDKKWLFASITGVIGFATKSLLGK